MFLCVLQTHQSKSILSWIHSSFIKHVDFMKYSSSTFIKHIRQAHSSSTFIRNLDPAPSSSTFINYIHQAHFIEHAHQHASRAHSPNTFSKHIHQAHLSTPFFKHINPSSLWSLVIKRIKYRYSHHSRRVLLPLRIKYSHQVPSITASMSNHNNKQSDVTTVWNVGLWGWGGVEECRDGPVTCRLHGIYLSLVCVQESHVLEFHGKVGNYETSSKSVLQFADICCLKSSADS